MGRILKPTTPTKGPEDWRAFLGDPIKHWRKGYSAMACAYAWENADGLPDEIAAVFGEDAKLVLAIPEYKVSIPGRGADSQCDVFALVRASEKLIAVSVEAKVNESFDKTVADWLAHGGANRVSRLKGLCDVIGCSTSGIEQLRYQLFHRTAAAVLEAQAFSADAAAMVVQSFSSESKWKEDFDAFIDHLGASTELDVPCGLPLTLAWTVCAFPPEAVE